MKMKRTQNILLRVSKKVVIIILLLLVLDFSGIFIKVLEMDYETFYHYPPGKTNVSSRYNLKKYYFPTIQFINQYPMCDQFLNYPDIVLIIKSSISNFKRRDIIRRTWGSRMRYLNITIVHVFVVGTGNYNLSLKVNEEAKRNNDILQGDFVDAYFNNTFKIRLGMQWSTQYCKSGKYYVFVDDDYYVSMKNIIRFVVQPSLYPEKNYQMDDISKRLKSINEKKKEPYRFNRELFAGFVFQTAPLRYKFSKWYVSLEEYPFNEWPPYVTAGAFILSHDTIERMYYESLHIPSFRFDDIYLGIIALKANVTVTHCPLFFFKKPSYAGPESYRDVIASHGFSNSLEMEKIWNQCQSSGYA